MTTTQKTLKWKRTAPGRQDSTDGKWAVQSDGYKPGYIRDGWGNIDGDGGEWAAIDTERDDNMDWFPTAREAKAFCAEQAARQAR